MSSEGWPEVRLADIQADVPNAIAAGPFGSNLIRSDYRPSGVPVIRGSNLDGSRGRFNDNAFVFVSPEKADSMTGNFARPGDIIVTQRGTLGQVSLIPDGGQYERFVLSQSQMKLTCDRAKVDPLFVFYWLSSSSTVDYIKRNAVTTGVPHINLSFFREMRMPLLPLPRQRDIARILGALDDKIEVNRRMNRTLESIARAIFKSWFVDFEPVRKKMEGKEVGLPADVAALFPCSLAQSGNGEVPQNWSFATLGDVAVQIRSQARPEELESGTPYFGLAHLPRRSIALSDWDVADGVVSAKLRFAEGDVLFGKLRPYFHKVGPAPVDGVCSTDILVVRPRDSQPATFRFLLGHLSSDEFVDYASATSSGTRMPRTNWSDMAAFPVVVPSSGVLEAYEAAVSGLFRLIRRNILELRELTEVRDALLPRLLSGELDAPGVPVSKRMVAT